jgi:methyl-accepting chemotaxis protein
VTSGEIDCNLGEAAKGGKEIATNVSAAAEVASASAVGASQGETAAEELSQIARSLDSMLRKYRL